MSEEDIEKQIKKLQSERALILKEKEEKEREKAKAEQLSKSAMSKLYGYSKEKAYSTIKNILRGLCKNSDGVNEVFGINNNYFIQTSATIDDIEKDEFLLDMLISKIGMKTFSEVETAYSKFSHHTKNIMRNFYKKLGSKEIVSYLKKEYPLENKINWIKKQGTGVGKDFNYLCKVGAKQKNNKVGIYFKNKKLSQYDIRIGDKILLAVVGDKIWLKKDDEGYKLTHNGKSNGILSIALLNDDFKSLNNTVFNKASINGEVIIFEKD